MALLELGGKKFTIPVGEVTLGSDAGCAISVAGPAVLPQHALLQGQADGQVIIRKASPAADVLINGVRLGAEPTPLLHGDKVEVGGHELTFVDERRSCSGAKRGPTWSSSARTCRVATPRSCRRRRATCSWTRAPTARS